MVFLGRGLPGHHGHGYRLYRYAAYHPPYDTPEKLDYERLARVVSGLAPTILELAAANLEQTTGSPTKGYAIAHNDGGQAAVIGAKMED